MKALSVRQPWAWLICAGYKDIENRNWKIGRKSQHGPYNSYHQANFTIDIPSRIYVHASKTYDKGAILPDGLPGPDCVVILARMAKEFGDKWPLGVIIGEIDIINCVTESTSVWFEGRYGFVLENPRLYKAYIPYAGQLGFFEVQINIS